MAEFPVVLATCYGASNTGQLAGAVATELAKENPDYSLVCLPAVAIDKDTGLNKVKGAGLFVIIEGCPVMCCSKIVEEHAGRKADIRVEMVQDYGVKKVSALGYDEAEKESIKQDIKKRIKEKLAEKRLEEVQHMEIKILGTGCPKCRRLEQLAHEAVEEAGIEANIVHVTDMNAIMAYPITSTPGLVINEELKSSGRLPRKEEIIAWLRAAQ